MSVNLWLTAVRNLVKFIDRMSFDYWNFPPIHAIKDMAARGEYGLVADFIAAAESGLEGVGSNEWIMELGRDLVVVNRSYREYYTLKQAGDDLLIKFVGSDHEKIRGATEDVFLMIADQLSSYLNPISE